MAEVDWASKKRQMKVKDFGGMIISAT